MAHISQYKSGGWRAVVRRVGHPVVSEIKPTKREAQQWAAEVEGKMGGGRMTEEQLLEAKLTTVQMTFERYRDEVAAKSKSRNEVPTVNRLIRTGAAFMSKRLDRVMPEDIRQWRDRRAQDIAPATVNREMNTMSAVFRTAIKEWGARLQQNPCHLVSQFAGAYTPRKARWSEEDIQTYLKAAKHDSGAAPRVGRDYVGWCLLLSIETAMREGELCSLTVADYHRDDRYVHLQHTKNGDERNVPLSRRAIEILDVLVKDKRPDQKIVPISGGTLSEYSTDVRKACGLEHLKFHDTRREATTRLAAKLSSVLELAAVTGHRDLKVLQRTYYAPKPASIADKLG